MASTINSTSVGSGGLVSTGDDSGQLELQTDGTTRVTINSSGNATFAGDVSVTGSLSTTGGIPTPLVVKGNATAGAELRLPEDTDNGSNYVALKAADNIASNVTFTLPSADGTSGQLIQTNASGVLSFGNVAVANGGTGQTSLTSNNVILGNGTSAVQFVAPGTNGNVLTSNGTTWTSAAAPAGGSLIYITSVTGSNAATIDLESTYGSTYAMYMIIGESIYGSTNLRNLYIQLKIGGSYISGTAYRRAAGGVDSTTSAFDPTVGNSAGEIYTSSSNNLSNLSDTVISLIAYVPNPSSTSQYKTIFGSTFGGNGDNDAIYSDFVGFARGTTTSALTGVRFFASTGNLYGTFRLYGIKNS